MCQKAKEILQVSKKNNIRRRNKKYEQSLFSEDEKLMENKNIQILISLIIKDMQIKTIRKPHFPCFKLIQHLFH